MNFYMQCCFELAFIADSLTDENKNENYLKSDVTFGEKQASEFSMHFFKDNSRYLLTNWLLSSEPQCLDNKMDVFYYVKHW